jgi:hypothetical protein
MSSYERYERRTIDDHAMDRESMKGHAIKRETMGCGDATESMVDTVEW